MDDDLHARIRSLVEEEHRLRTVHADGSGLDEAERQRMRGLEEQLDQAWDLLRQRDALREAGRPTSSAHERSAGVVEGYLG